MDEGLRRAVFRLCQGGDAREAVRILRAHPGLRRHPDPRIRMSGLRLWGDALLAAGLLRPAAAAHWRVLRLKRRGRMPLQPADWAPLAAAYRELWRRTGRRDYLQRYLSFSREDADQLQIGLAREALAAIRRRRRAARSETRPGASAGRRPPERAGREAV